MIHRTRKISFSYGNLKSLYTYQKSVEKKQRQWFFSRRTVLFLLTWTILTSNILYFFSQLFLMQRPWFACCFYWLCICLFMMTHTHEIFRFYTTLQCLQFLQEFFTFFTYLNNLFAKFMGVQWYYNSTFLSTRFSSSLA